MEELLLLRQTVFAARMKSQNILFSEPKMIRKKAEKNALRAANFGFGALLFVLFGWINVEILLLSNSAGIHGQLLNFAFGAPLSTIAYRRYRAWWTPLARSMYGDSSRSSFREHWTTIFLLASAGFLFACMMRMDLLTSVVAGAGILTFIPWARSSFCKKHFFVSHALLVSGGLPVLLINAKYHHPLILLAETWALWVLAAGLLLSALLAQKSTVSKEDRLRAEPKVHEHEM